MNVNLNEKRRVESFSSGIQFFELDTLCHHKKQSNWPRLHPVVEPTKITEAIETQLV